MAKLLKYNRAKFRVLDRIAALGLKPGDPLPTQAELLRDGGFSLICLKRALMELEESGILSKGQGRRATLLKPLVRDCFSGSVVFVNIYRYTPAVPEGVYELRDEFARRGIELKIENRDRPERDIGALCRGALGIIVMGWITREWLDYLNIYRLPLMAIGSNPFPDELPGVGMDWYRATLFLCRELRRRGAERIALANGAWHYLPAREIERAVLDDAASAGDSTPERFRIHGDRFKPEERYAQIRSLLKRHENFDALVVELGMLNELLLNARDLALPDRIRLAVGLERALPETMTYPDIVTNYFPESLYARSADFFLDRIESGRTGVVEQLLLKPYKGEI